MLFTSQFGLVRVADLPVVSRLDVSGGGNMSMDATGSRAGEDNRSAMTTAPASGTGTTSSVPNLATPEPSAGQIGAAARMSPDEVLSVIENVADLPGKGILTDAEFEAKKAELLSRL